MEFVLSRCLNHNCKIPPHTYTHVIANTLTKKMREYIHDYYLVSFNYKI